MHAPAVHTLSDRQKQQKEEVKHALVCMRGDLRETEGVFTLGAASRGLRVRSRILKQFHPVRTAAKLLEIHNCL